MQRLHTNFMNYQRLMGFDFGLKRIGTAIGQVVTGTASPLEVVTAVKLGEPNWVHITKLIKKWRPDACIVGLPLNMDGSNQTITLAAQQFCQDLKEKFNLPVHQMDERLTTKAAREILFENGGFKALQHGQVDCMAAKLILENWFQMHS